MKRQIYILLFAIVSLPIFADARLDSLFYQALLDDDWNKMTYYAKQGANVDITLNNDFGVTLLHNCAMYGYIEGVQWCIDNKANLNVKDLNGLTPLHYAVISQQTTICKLLVENGAGITGAGKKGITPIDIAEKVSNPGLAKYLKDPGKNKLPVDFNAVRLKVILLEKNNDFEQAIKDLQAGIKEADKTLPPSNKFYSLLWVDLANAYYLVGENEKAQEAIEEGFSRVKKHAYGSETYYRVLAGKCDYWLENKNIDEAVDSLLVCGKYIDNFSDFETKYAIMSGLGYAAVEKNLYNDAIDLYYAAINYAKNLMLFNKKAYEDYYYTAMLALCRVYEGKGNADDLNHAIIVMFQIDDAFKDRHDYLSALYAIRKGYIYYSQGDFYRAEEWYMRAERDWYHSRGTRHNAYADILYYLAETNSALHRFETSVDLYKASLGYRIKNNSTNSVEFALRLTGLSEAMLLSNLMGGKHYHYKEIDNNIYLAVDIINKIKGRENFEYIVAVNTLCQSLYAQNSDSLAKCYALPFYLTKKIVSPNHTFYQNRLMDTYMYSAAVGDDVLSYSSIIEYDSIAKKSILDYFLILSEDQRARFWTKRDYSISFESIIPTYIHNNVEKLPTLSEIAYNDALFRKGILLNTTQAITNSINNSNDLQLIALYHQLMADKIRYNELSSVVSSERNDDAIFMLQDSINDIEQYITSECRAYVDYNELGNVSWRDIQNALKTGQVAIEMISFDYFNGIDTISRTYNIATIVTKDSHLPQYVYLFEESELIPFIKSSNKDNIYDYNRNGRQLSEMIWSKLRPYIGDAKTIYFSPDGLLCQLAVEALPISADSVYGDAYDIVRCSSTKYVLQQRKEENPTSIDLFGGIQYDMNPEEMVQNSHGLAIHEAYRGELAGSHNRGHYEELNGAKEEVSNIASIMRQANIDGRLYMGSLASEEAFKALSGSRPNILHIATHGFFWPQEEAERKDYFMASFMVNPKSSRYVSSMERAGLLFAGANVAMTGHRDELPANVEDGVLSAQEISTMDLYGTDLVVLSACETGQGDLRGDGVYGLQRAFKLAGVQTIIMSLWKVNDAATQMLMTEFYTNWIVNKMSKRKAFDIAKQKVRTKFPEPSYWAGFIMLD